MPISPFLRNEASDPELIEAVSAAFTKSCKALGLVDRDDPMNELVARHIIELAQRGIRTTSALYTHTLQEYRTNAE